MASALTTHLVRRQTVARDVLELEFQLDTPQQIDFRAGQFVTFTVGQTPDGTAIRRSYSIAAYDRATRLLRFFVKVTSDGPAGAYLGPLPVGSRVEMTGPHGFFMLDANHPGDVVFAATGTGIAPVLAFLHELGPRHEPGRRYLYWGLRDESDLIRPDALKTVCDEARCALYIHLSRPSKTWTGNTGRITGPILERVTTLTHPVFYLVGSGAMIRELKTGLIERGIERKRQIRTEAFFDD